MIQKISDKCAKSIIALGKIKDINEHILRYGCELILTSLFGLLLLITQSIIVGHPVAWLFFVFGFAPHRTSAGGYHADTHSRCFLVTSGLFLLSVIAAYGMRWSCFAYIAIGIFSAFCVVLLAPLEALNKPLSDKRFRSNKRKSIIVVSLNIVIAVILSMLNQISEEANMYYAGIFFAAISLIIGKIKNSTKGEN